MFSRFPSRFLPGFFYSPDDPPSGAGQNSTPVVNPVVKPSKEEVEAAVRARIDEILGSKKASGDPMEALAISMKAQYRLETEKANLETQIAQLKQRAVPEGSIVLNKDEAALWDEAKQFGTADKFKAALKERDDFKEKAEGLEAEKSRLQRDETLRDVAEKAGFKFTVLKDRDQNTPGLEYSVKTEKNEKGEDVQVAYVKYKDGDGDNAPVKERKLAEYAGEKWADFLPALMPANTANTPTGGRHVAQGNNNSGGTANKYERVRRENEKEAEARAKSGESQSLEQAMGIGTNQM